MVAYYCLYYCDMSQTCSRDVCVVFLFMLPCCPYKADCGFPHFTPNFQLVINCTVVCRFVGIVFLPSL